MGRDIGQLEEEATRAFQAGNLIQAETSCRTLLQRNPENAQAYTILGLIAVKNRQIDKGIPLLQKATELEPFAFDALVWLCNLHRMTGDPAKGLDYGKRAYAIQGDHPAALAALGLSFLAVGDAVAAVSILDKAVKIDPRSAPLQHNYARALQLSGKNAAARSAYRRATELAPRNPESWISLGQLVYEMGQRPEAVTLFRHAYSLEPDSVRGLMQLAKAQIEDGEIEEAEKTLRNAIKKDSGQASAFGLLGNVLQQLGRFEEATGVLTQAIELQPGVARPYFDLAYCQNSANSPFTSRMLAMTQEPTRNDDDLRHLHYALAKSFADSKQFERAMAEFDLANESMNRLVSPVFNQEEHRRDVNLHIQKFTKRHFEETRMAGMESDLPVFIVGMIRSGTTLTEQIISRHPQMGGAGELLFWQEKAPVAMRSGDDRVDTKKLGQLGQEYLAELKKFGPQKQRISDKMPLNFLHLGLIHQIFPHAKIIHCRRNPLDTCLSIYLTPFPTPVNFAHDKARIVSFYREYLRLMEHWRSVLPSDILLEMDYEAVVTDREKEARRLVEFLEMPWSDACLSPEQNDRVVRTPSMWQVRQPVYQSSVGRWRDYQPWLGALAQVADWPTTH